jgi:hypothetical protein
MLGVSEAAFLGRRTNRYRRLSSCAADPGPHSGRLDHPVTGGDLFDLQIVATMQANGIQRIYTFNTGDFEPFSELAVVTL